MLNLRYKIEGTQAADDRTTQWGDDERTQAGAKPNEPEELDEEELEHKLAIDLRCVILCVGMLERVNSVSLSVYAFVEDDPIHESE